MGWKIILLFLRALAIHLYMLLLDNKAFEARKRIKSGANLLKRVAVS